MENGCVDWVFYFAMDSLEVIPLHHHEEFSEACCDLINSEWKRTQAARMASLQKSCDTFPTSLVMVLDKNEVVGHSRLSAIPPIPDACFIESVVIGKEFRGRGWGKYLMLATEEYARSCNLQQVYLAAKPPVPSFYSRLGYDECPAVNLYGPAPDPPAAEEGDGGEEGEVGDETGITEAAVVCPTAPPPPPLPPRRTGYKLYRTLSKKPKTYMRKSLYEEAEQ